MAPSEENPHKQKTPLAQEQGRMKAAPEKTEVDPKVKGSNVSTMHKKLEAMERLNNDGKQMTLAELQRNKAELERQKRVNNEQSDRILRLQKQVEAAEGRADDFKRSAAADRTEIKSLQHKIRMLEQEKDQRSAKLKDAAETKRALHALESKKKEEEEAKVTELRKLLGSEKQRCSAAEAQLAQLKATSDKARQLVEARLQDALAQTKEAERERDSLRVSEQGLIAQLETCKKLLQKSATLYGQLVASTRDSDFSSEVEDFAARAKVMRLERKLANSNDQVVELGHFVRYYQEQNIFLKQSLRDAEEQIVFMHSIMDSPPLDMDPNWAVAFALDGLDHCESELDLGNTIFDLFSSSSDFFNLRLNDFFQLCQSLDSDSSRGLLLCDKWEEYATTRESLLETTTQELSSLQELRVQQDVQVAQLHQQVESVRSEIEVAKEQTQVEVEKVEELLSKEREGHRKVTAALKQAKMAEEGFRAEISELANNLVEAERYKEAYMDLCDEVGRLIDRNALAEEEATRLSAMNAEILGHNNPVQRIFYVDRIRRELADVKQKLILSTRDFEAICDENKALEHELKAYKSVAVPYNEKQRTHLTRIARKPLERLKGTNGHLHRGEEMTIEELM